ncbi:MAG: autotransporter-associated beta strand repeat-containing protein [bacterium]
MNTMMKKFVGCVCFFMSLTWASQAGGIFTWTNGTGDNTGNWSVGANWTNNVAPTNTSSFVFGATTGTTTLTNDITFTSLGTITFNSDAPAYTMNGNPLASGGTAYFGGFIVNSGSSITQTINLNLGALYENAFNVSGGGNLTLGGSSGKGGTYNPNLTMNGTGVLTLNGATGFGAPYLTVNTGTVVLAKSVTAGVGSSITINNVGMVILGSSNQVSGTLTMSAGATFDLNGYDSGSMVAPNQAGFFQINGTGGLIVNNASGTGTNVLQLGGMNLAGSYGAFGGRIMDGSSAKTALGLGYNCWNSVFQMLTGNNTYSGGTTFGPKSQTSTYTGGSTLSISSMQNIGAAGSRNLAFSGPASFVAQSILQITGTEITDSSGFDSIIFNPGTRVGFDIADPSNTFTLSQALTNGASGVFAKRGAGTLVLKGAATYTGATTIEGGILKVDYQSGSLNSATAPTFSGGNLFLLGKNSGTTSQTLGNLTVSTGGGNLLIDPNNGPSTTLALGTLTTTAAGGSFMLGKVLNAGGGAVTNTTTTNKKTDGTYGGRVIFATGIANTGYDFATTLTGTPYVLSAYTSATVLPTSVGASATNYKMISNTALVGNVAANSLKLESPSGDLALAGYTLTNTSGGLLSVGTSAVQITGDAGVIGLTAGNGSGTYDLIVHQYNSNGLNIGAVIGNNGANAVALVKAGTETLTLSGINTYTGATYINGGALSITADNNLCGFNGTLTPLCSTNGTAVTCSAASLPTGFAVGASLLGRAVNATGGVSGAYTITLSGAPSAVLTNGTASWAYIPSAVLYINNGGRLQTSGNFALNESNSGGTAGTTTQNRTITIGSGGGGIEILSGTLTNSGAITANGQFIKSGPGMMVSTVANTFNMGGLTVNDGTMLFTAANTFNNRVTVNSGTLRFSLTGNNLYGGVTLNGGMLQFDAANTIAGGMTLNGGALSINSLSYVGSTPLTFAGGNLQVTSTSMTTVNSLNVNGANFSGGFDITNATASFIVTNAISGSGSLVKSGSGTLVLTGSNTYSGSTTISNGTLIARVAVPIVNAGFESPSSGAWTYMKDFSGKDNDGVLGGWRSATSNLVGFCQGTFCPTPLPEGIQGAFIQVPGYIEQVITVPEDGTYQLAFKFVRRRTVNVGISVKFNGVMKASWPLAGTYSAWTSMLTNITLTAGACTTRFENATGDDVTIDDVRLYTARGSLSTNTDLSIIAGATFDLGFSLQTVRNLAGAGTIATEAGGTLTVTGTNSFTGTIAGNGALNVSGVISPAGPGVFGTNTVAQALTFSGTLEVDVATDGSSDRLVTQGTLDLTGATLSVVNSSGLNKDKQYVILTYSVAPTGTFSDSNLPRGWTTKNDTTNKRILLRANTGTMIRFF